MMIKVQSKENPEKNCFFPDFRALNPKDPVYLTAWRRSALISSICSIPTEILMASGSTPDASCSSALNCSWVVLAGWWALGVCMEVSFVTPVTVDIRLQFPMGNPYCRFLENLDISHGQSLRPERWQRGCLRSLVGDTLRVSRPASFRWLASQEGARPKYECHECKVYQSTLLGL